MLFPSPRPLSPNAPLIDSQNGLEYKDFGDWLLSKPVDCPRNDVIRTLHDHPSVKSGEATWREVVGWQYRYQNRQGEQYVAGTRIGFPQGIENFPSALAP